MTKLSDLQFQIESVHKLSDIISALRSLAALRVRQTHEALNAIRHYTDTVNSSLGQVVSTLVSILPETSADKAPRKAVLAFCSEYGFVGAFNHQIITRATHEISTDSLLFIIGARGALAAKERNIDVERRIPMPTNITGIPEAAREITEALYHRFESGEIGGVDLVFGVQNEEGSILPRRQTLLPLDLRTFQVATNTVPPLTTLEPNELLGQVVAQYFYAAITLATTESLVVINEARLAAMDQAHHNIEAKHEELVRSAHVMGQEETTTELQDIIIGAQAALSR